MAGNSWRQQQRLIMLWGLSQDLTAPTNTSQISNLAVTVAPQQLLQLILRTGFAGLPVSHFEGLLVTFKCAGMTETPPQLLL